MAVSYPILAGSAKITIRAPQARAFEALLNREDLAAWWSPNAHVEPELGGRYETDPPEGRQAGLIVGMEAPRRLTFTWPMLVKTTVVDTTVTYELSPKGPETVVHVIHRSRVRLGHSSSATWQRALEALKAHLEGEQAKGQG